MTKNVDYEISVLDILKLIVQKNKFICIIALICLLLCGGYKAITGGSEEVAIPAETNYEKDLELFQYYKEIEQELPTAFKADWEKICREKMSNPIYSIDPFKCKYTQIVIRFGDEIDNHSQTVQNWIYKADNNKLFGEKAEALSDYKNTLVVVDWSEEQAPLLSETTVQLIAVDGFDIEKATDYLLDFFNQCARSENIDVVSFSEADAEGYNSFVDQYQENNRRLYGSIYNSLVYSKNMQTYITEPQLPQENSTSKVKEVIKFAIIGLILGLIIGIVLVLLNAIRKREIISKNQIENAFNLELLSDCSTENETAIDVLNANLDVMTGEHNVIAIIADESIKEMDELVSAWNQQSDRTYLLCNDIFETPSTIEDLRTAAGVVIGVKIGQSKLEQIQKVILRTDKLKQKVLGYVLI